MFRKQLLFALLICTFPCSASVAVRHRHLTKSALNKAFFYVHYRVFNEETKRSRPPLGCWVAGDITVAEAHEQWDGETGNTGGALYVVPTIGKEKRLDYKLKFMGITVLSKTANKTFAQLADSGPDQYKYPLIEEYNCLRTEVEVDKFFEEEVFERKIAMLYALVKRPGGKIKSLPINALVRHEEAEIYRMGECMGRKFFYNRALTDRRIIHAMIKHFTLLDNLETTYTPEKIKRLQPPPPFVSVMDWGPASDHWVVSTLVLYYTPPSHNGPLDEKKETRGQSQPTQETSHRSGVRKHEVYPPKHFAQATLIGEPIHLKDELAKEAAQGGGVQGFDASAPEGYLFSGRMAVTLCLGAVVGGGIMTKLRVKASSASKQGRFKKRGKG